MKNWNLLSTASLLALFVSCRSGENATGFYNEPSTNKEYKINDEEPAKPFSGEQAEDFSIQDRKLIKTGSVSFETDNLKTTRALIDQAVIDNKGYISKENEDQYDKRIQQTITVRVPSQNFDKLLESVSASVKKFDYKNIDVNDVTEEFVDAEARLKTKKELEVRYKEILTKANTVEDILSIERQIGELRAEIESIEGRLKYLQNQVSYSTLTITFYQTVSVATEFSGKFSEGFKNGWNNMIWFLVGITNVWPFILVIAGFIFFIWRKIKRRNAQ